MKPLTSLIASNRRWASEIAARDPHFFGDMLEKQTPKYLWIGCSDSRVPANQIVGLLPGEMFVHRNVANVVVHSDLNCLSVIQYAVDVLNIEQIIVCGHYGCGGVRAAYDDCRIGLVSNWLRHVQDIADHHHLRLTSLPTDEARLNRLCELNVIEQVVNVCQTTVVHAAWERGQELSIHGLIYGLKDGLLQDLGIGIGARNEIGGNYREALLRLEHRGGENP